MTDRTGFYLLPILAALTATACAMTRDLDTALAGQPPEYLRGPIDTVVEWRSAEAVAVECARMQASFGKFPMGAHACAYARPGGPITLILPRDLHPLIVHELGHAHQLQMRKPVDHKGWK